MILRSNIVVAADVPDDRLRELFDIFSRHYDGVAWEAFARDWGEKDYAILLHDESGTIRGFSTQQILRLSVGNSMVRALFSGDTIIDRAFWGEQELVRGWCRFAGQLLISEPEVPLYWFLISKGYRTYLFLPLFFRKYIPALDSSADPSEKMILDELAMAKFGDHYDPRSGLIRFPVSHGQLNKELGEIPVSRLNHPHVRYFLTKNPTYQSGTELACLAQIRPENMRSIAAKALRDGMNAGALHNAMVYA